MEIVNESNVDQFKTEHECDEHWELRRRFLLAHGNKFPKDELMCLAQVFTNVEFLGCKYPKETMRMISELSKEVVGDYREKQKNRLRRTFVGASDAASSKAKGQSRTEKPSTTVSSPTSSQESSKKNNYQGLYNNFQKKQDFTTEKTSTTVSSPISSGEPSKKNNQGLYNNFQRKQDFTTAKPSTTLSSPASSGEFSRQNNSFKRKQDFTPQNRFTDTKKKRPNSKSDVVLFEYLSDTPQSIVSRAAVSYDFSLEWKFEIVGNDFACSVLFNNHKVATARAPNQKAAKKEAATLALAEMRKIYYTIKVTKNLTPTVSDDLDTKVDTKSDALGSDNIGSKMMKLMGWSGGGLGKSSQGITEPVNVQQQMTREGLGLKAGFYNMHVFKKKCTEVLENYVRGDTSTDLVFNPSFTNEERATIHQIAKQLGLKSQSYGPKTQRTLTISRKINPQDLVNELIELGGSTEKYQLIEPTGK